MPPAMPRGSRLPLGLSPCLIRGQGFISLERRAHKDLVYAQRRSRDLAATLRSRREAPLEVRYVARVEDHATAGICICPTR